MDFSQLLSSGFQFLNLDDACEAEVDILQDMLFKKQDADQLSKLFHLKSYPDGDGACSKYYTLDQVRSALLAGHSESGGDISPSDVCNSDQRQPGPVADLREAALVSSDMTIPLANGPMMPMSPQQHHMMGMETSTSESGEMNQPMMSTIPTPLRSYYSQQHVPVVHASPQPQVGSSGIGQPHGQVGIPAYSHVSVPISVHQQQLIMMQAQPQAGQAYVGLQPVHYVPSPRHPGHPPHSFVQGEHPLSPESVQYHHNPNLIKVTHESPSHTLPHTHPSNASTQGGPSKYSNGPRKNHSRSIDRSRSRDQEMMNAYPAYAYSGIAYPNVAYYNQQLAHTVTGSPIIMPASHHNKAPVTVYQQYVTSHQYTSPPPNAPPTMTSNVSPPDSQQPHAIPVSDANTLGSQPQHHPTATQSAEIVAENVCAPNAVPPPAYSSKNDSDMPSQTDNQSDVRDNVNSCDETPTEKLFDCSLGLVEDKKDLGAPSSPPKSISLQNPQDQVVSSSQPVEHSMGGSQELRSQIPRESPVSEQVVQQSVTFSLPATAAEESSNRLQSTNNSAGLGAPVSEPAVTVIPSAQPKVQTWAETSAPKPQRANNISNNPTISSNIAASVDDKTLKDKQGQPKSAEFPALAKLNVNGNIGASALPAGTSSAPKGRSWASICRNPNAPAGTVSASTANGGCVTGVSSNSVQSAGVPHTVSYEGVANSSPPSSLSSGSSNPNGNVSGGISADKPNAAAVVGCSDNNGHTYVPIQNQTSDKPKPSTSTDPSFDPSCLSNENDALAIRLGEFLAGYTLDHHATALTPRGLTNQSNFCYINATLQALMACPPFVNLFRSLKEVGLAKTPCTATPIIQSVFDFVSEFEPLNRGNTNKRDRRSDSFTTGANLEPSGIRNVLGLLDGSTFKVEGRQQDAEEFLSHLLNGLHDEMIKVIKWYENSKSGGIVPGQQAGSVIVNGQHTEEVAHEEDDDADHWQVMGPRNKGCLTRKTNVVKSPISEMLFGQLCSALHRTNSFKSATLQPFFTLQLDIQSDSIRSVRDALEGLSYKEEVSGLVSNSGQETEAWRQLSLEELPMILILHLKRFVYDKSGHKIQKLDKKLEFGIDLEIAKELLSVNTRGKWTVKQRQYKLFAVVYHDGEEAYKGHYVADCFHPSGGHLWGQVGWLRYDDVAVKPIPENSMLNSQPPRVPYLLYYRRADTLLSHHTQIPRNKDRPRNFSSTDS